MSMLKALIFNQAPLYFHTFLDVRPNLERSWVQEIIRKVYIFSVEAFCTFTCVLPSSVQWLVEKHLSHKIETFRIEKPGQKTAYLHQYGTVKDPSHAILLIPGDNAPPFTLFHLAKTAEQEGVAPFILEVPGLAEEDNKDYIHSVITQSIEKMKSLLENESIKILGAGHSRGSIFLAEYQFSERISPLEALCLMGGRLNAPEEKDCKNDYLRERVKNIYANLQTSSKKPLHLIVGNNDWNASQESMLATDTVATVHSVPGMHLSSVYREETTCLFRQFLQSAQT